MSSPIHAVIIAWEGYHDRALNIAENLQGAVHRLTVIYSNKAGVEESGPGDWVSVPQSWYFGRKFQKSLELHKPGEILLQIQADADYEDWAALAADCAQTFTQRPNIGVWAPDIRWTPWPTEIVEIDKIDNTSLVHVAQTDGVVWALSGPVIDRLRQLNYADNNLGWGIDWVATCYARQLGLQVVRDLAHRVHHPESRGYNGAEAAQQMKNFISQLPPSLQDDITSFHADLQRRKTKRTKAVDHASPKTLPAGRSNQSHESTGGKQMLKKTENSLISEIYLIEDSVFVKGAAGLAKSSPYLRCGNRELPFARLEQPPAFNLVPRSFPIAPLEREGADQKLNDLAWQVPDWNTLRVVAFDQAGPQRIPLGGDIRVDPGNEPIAFMAELACHRAKGALLVILSDESGKTVKELRVPFDSSCTGGNNPDGYQRARVVLPPRHETQILTLQVDYMGGHSQTENEPHVFFIASPRLSAAAAGDLLSPVALHLGQVAKPVWYQAKFPRARLAAQDDIVLVAGKSRIPLLPAQHASVALTHDWGHALELKADRDLRAIAWVDGEAGFPVTLTQGENFLRLPPQYLTGQHTRFELRDLSGSRSYWENWILPPRHLTPGTVMQHESRAPYPSELFPQSPFRFRALRKHYAEGADPAMLAQLSQAIDALEAGYEKLKLKPLAFPEVDAPDVSIVIPAHNKIKVTYAGLCALLLAWNKASFEVILVDDASTDETAEIETFVSGITVVRNKEPQRFIRACNAGVAKARGKYVVLLNNDTEPTMGWLDELVAAFDRFPNVGLVGSKLLYPNGKLQDAGGIIWGSGNPWNYGNRQNPWEPRFCYARQADYLSGAAMMTTRDIWDKVGGLSHYLEPMYFEDTDFAFKIREAGYTTWFVPASIVYHYEGMTSGTDTSSGFKRFQETNRPKFKRRWAKAFGGFGKEGVEPDLEKDRGIVGRVLFIDYTTPTPDQNAGSYAALQEIRLVQSLGYKVTFLPENLAHLGRYTTDLEKMGVEMIVSPFYRSIDEFLKARGQEFDAFYITRYHVVNAVAAKIRAVNQQARILMNNADLHYLRLLRKGISEKDEEQIEAAREVQAEEFSAMKSVDVVLSYNEMEHAVIEAQSEGAIKVKTCPWVLECPETVPPREGRSGLSFLGGFRHHPNVEGMEWFAQSVMSRIEHEHPDIHLFIYGAHMGDEVTDLASSAITPVGFVENIADAYDKHLVFVAPLLSGAGIKGKVLSALAHGIPCVLSPLAAEGIGLLHGRDCLIADTPDEWVSAISQLYNDAALWQKLSENGHELAQGRFSFENARKQMRAAFEAVDLFTGID